MLITPDGGKCSTCKSPLRMVSSTLGVCPHCSDAPVAPIDFSPVHKLKAPRRTKIIELGGSPATKTTVRCGRAVSETYAGLGGSMPRCTRRSLVVIAAGMPGTTAPAPPTLPSEMPGPIFAIPPRVRRAILDLLDGWGASPETIVAEIGKRRGFATIGDLFAYLNETYGGEARAQFGGTLMQFVHELTPEGASRPESDAAAALSAVATPALLGLPDDLFLFAAELGRAHVAGFHADLSGGVDPTYPEYQARLSELFLANGIPYELDEDGRFVATGSPTVFATSVGPAMDALDEPRLATARMHLIEAQRRLQEPDQEEAVDEARQAVEAAMIAVLDACGIPVPEKRQPDELFNALAPKDPDQPRAMSRDALELVLATPRFRGRTAAGHAGGPAVTLGEAQAAVAAASAAILYLADKLPE